MQIVRGNIVDTERREIFKGTVVIADGIIADIRREDNEVDSYIIPGFVDAHVHIESSLLTPAAFGDLVSRCGVVAVVADPHEIANVMGREGVEFMRQDAVQSPIKSYFTIPSSVPATPFDCAGGVIDADTVAEMVASGGYVGLSEVMNVPGVLFEDTEVMAKLSTAKAHNIPIDGHAPLLHGESLAKYVASGISTDHECSTLEEAKEKIALGMKILIREGSAAHNFETLKELIAIAPHRVMFCSDDIHPDDIVAGRYINSLVTRALKDGYNLFDVLRIASHNPIEHYNLPVGLLRVGDRADFQVVADLITLTPQAVYIDGKEQLSTPHLVPKEIQINNFNHQSISLSDLKRAVHAPIDIISVRAGQLITDIERYTPSKDIANLESDIKHDVAKIVYINRYNNGVPQVAYCSGFGMQCGAIASSIAHDSHNIIAIGCSDAALQQAINAVIENSGALAVSVNNTCSVLPLPVGGIMSNKSGLEIATRYQHICNISKETGCHLHSPFMTLSFMSLVVIPSIKIGEKGLFSYDKFDWIDGSTASL